MTSLLPSRKVGSTWIIEIISGTPFITSARLEDFAAGAHDLGHRFAFSSHLHELSRDQCRRFGDVQLQAALLAILGHLGGQVDEQLVPFLR